ncbi:MAG: hypothetical protein KF857_05885 [Fimbriimonadaceae bacterium]|nr:hypothetical protein [Fimbriimonadaceae bacterium]
MVGIIGITRINVGRGALVEVEPTFLELQGEVRRVAPGVESSLWRCEDDDHRFLQLSTLPSVEVKDALVDHLVRTRLVEQAAERLHGIPDVQHFQPSWSMRVTAASVHQSALLSVSLRAMDLGFGDAWVEKLGDNFREVSVIPGFEGAMIAKSLVVEDQVLGLGFWSVSSAFHQSVPPRPSYEIDLYRRFR